MAAMQQALQVFETEDHLQFRTILKDGEPWFVLADVCAALDIGNPSDAARRLDDEERGLDTVDTLSGVQRMVIINESGLYSLILTSRKEGAKRFKKWVTSEVLPSIRKTGGFGGGTPAFIKRFQANWDRVDEGYFSVINELVVRLWGRLEMAGYVMPDRALDGKELRPDVSVGKRFAAWLDDLHPEAANDHAHYLHSTPQADVLARQYPRRLLPLYLDFIDQVWIPECAADYFRTRDPRALTYLPKLLPAPDKPKPGMMTTPTLRTAARKRWQI